MLTRRLVVCLDVKGGRVVKGTQFVHLRDVGDPVALASRYEREGADEIVFLDISASAEDRGTLFDVARRTAERLFVPLTLGGGLRAASSLLAAGCGWWCRCARGGGARASRRGEQGEHHPRRGRATRGAHRG